MESCLKELVLDAEATGFQDPEKGGWEPVGPSGRKTLPGGLDWRQPGVYSQPPEAKKLIPGIISRCTVLLLRRSFLFHFKLTGWNETVLMNL
jgi:hypothetical protein